MKTGFFSGRPEKSLRPVSSRVKALQRPYQRIIFRYFLSSDMADHRENILRENKICPCRCK
ncbi:MAG: hypothetical protein B6245_01260 [Desulfobacteraceae bacterium 4572_88]|nr:MAG: hypothetical protein B6245_01260 [Desulfobacteraceae bacterium 4572_88]